MNRILQAMKAVPMFSALSETALAGLLARCRPLHVAEGHAIFGPRQKADQLFIVIRGQVKIFKVSARGDEQILHVFGPGHTFGEAAMWAGIAYPARAEAIEDSEVVAIGKDDLRRAIAASPDLALKMMAGLSGKLAEFARLVEELSLKEVPARLAGVLLKEHERSGAKVIRLRQTKRHLAAQIGTIAETLSRALAKMKAQGLIEVRGSEIDLLDLEGLRELAENG